MHHELVTDIGIAIFVATATGFIAFKLHQPLILAYLVSGIIIGPQIGPAIIHVPENINTISELGLVLLLFIIGLELNLKVFYESAKKTILPGIMQFPLGVLLGLAICLGLSLYIKLDFYSSLYYSIGAALGSTAIVVRLLYEKHELDTLAGKATISILIFQDIWAILFLAIQPNLSEPSFVSVLIAIAKVIGLFASGLLISKYLLRKIFDQISHSPEMIVAMAIGWCVLLAGAGDWIGLSREMGSLVAGISIASFPYSMHVTSKILPLRDFFLTLFFISLGMKIPFPKIEFIIPAIALFVFIIVTRFWTLYPFMLFAGNGKRTGFITSLNLFQMSEFSLVIASIGVTKGHIDEDVMSVLLYTMSISSIIGSYLVKYNHKIFSVMDKYLPTFGTEDKFIKESVYSQNEDKREIYILGYHRGARAIVQDLMQRDFELLKSIAIIDFNTEIIPELNEVGVKVIIGDISSYDDLVHSGMHNAKIIVTTIPDLLLKNTNNYKMTTICRKISPGAFIITHADFVRQIDDLYKAGADEVILPYYLAGEYLAGVIEKKAAWMLIGKKTEEQVEIAVS